MSRSSFRAKSRRTSSPCGEKNPPHERTRDVAPGGSPLPVVRAVTVPACAFHYQSHRAGEFIESANSLDNADPSVSQTLLTDRQIHENHQSQQTDFQPPIPGCEADLSRRPYRRFMEGGLMKRVVLLTCVGITLMSVTGCAKWKQKHYYRSAYTDGDVCGCGVASAYDNVVPRQRAGSFPHLRRCCPRPSFDHDLQHDAVAAQLISEFHIPEFQIPVGLSDLLDSGTWNRGT